MANDKDELIPFNAKELEQMTGKAFCLVVVGHAKLEKEIQELDGKVYVIIEIGKKPFVLKYVLIALMIFIFSTFIYIIMF